MIYITKGRGRRGRQGVSVFHCGRSVLLRGEDARVWLRGHSGFCRAADAGEAECVLRLAGQDLAEYSYEDTVYGRYKILTNCVLCEGKRTGVFLSRREREMLAWIRHAGIQIGIAELVCLAEKGISPRRELLSAKNWRALAAALYGKRLVCYTGLEKRMEHAKCCNAVVAALMHLVATGHVRLV